MRILHISDLHFDDKKRYLDDIKEKFVELLTNEKIDYFIFSGDLISSPNKINDFVLAKEKFINPILKQLNLTDESFFICEGNHDAKRNEELPIISETFSKFKNNSEIENFIKINNGQQLEASLKNHQLYYDFIKNNINFPTNDIIIPLYSIHERLYNNKIINIVTINSAWRSTSTDNDQSNLFYPISILEEIVEKTGKDAFKILIMHHPL